MTTGEGRIGRPRGMRRLARAIARLGGVPVAPIPDLGPLGDHSVEFWCGDRCQPLPRRIRRAVVERLVTVHDAWATRLGEVPSPRYLGLWLFEPWIEESQVVVATGARALDFAARHDDAASPPTAWRRAWGDVERFAWTCHVHEERVPLAEVSARTHALLRALGARREGDVLVARHVRTLARLR